MSSAARVYEGFWMDHDHDRLSSARLTLDAYNATLLIAFIAIFVTICGHRMWSAVRFVLHQLRAGAERRGADDEHLQLLTVHSAMPGIAWDAPKLMWTTTRQTGRRDASTVCYVAVLAFLALFNFVAWTAAGVLSAWIAVSNGPLIYVSPDCGFYADPSDSVSFTPAAGFQARKTESYTAANRHAHSVVTREPYAELIPGRYPGEEYALYYYGDTFSSLNYTYQLSTGISAPGGFMPIPEITRSDAEVTLFFLVQNLLAYTAPVDDVFFAAHTQPTTYELSLSNDTYTLYYNDKLVSVMGCIDQHQICKPGYGEGPNCSALSSVENLWSEVATLELNQVQHDTAYVIQWEILGGEMLNSIAGRGAVALKAQGKVFNNINVPLPDNQWTLEVGGWFSIALARLQHAIVEYSTGPAHTDSGKYQRYTSSFLTRIYANTCNRQKGRQLSSSTSYLTFNGVGLLIISVVGAIVLLISPLLELIVGLRRSGKWSQRHLEWKLHGEFQRVASQSFQLTSPRPGGSGSEP
ncbi:Fc.00g045360.m01.CDS01 [Cosmosporella sp. VM-42]